MTFASGGGFSEWWPQPSYQNEPVASYIAEASKNKKLFPSQTLYNSSNAGYPDVAMHAENCALTQFGIPVPVSGTSCSAPCFAGLVALLNDARLSQQPPKRTLGWLNPLLYKHPEAFSDITKGSNPGCADDVSKGYLGEGFQATVGWDPVTGLGTPQFSELLKIVQALP